MASQRTSDDLAALVGEIRGRLEAAGTSERKEVAKWYFPSAMEPLGVASRDLRVVVRDIGKRLKGASPQDTLALAHALLKDGTFEGRRLAYELLSRHKPTLASLTTREIERLGKGIDNWASVDEFACLISGPAWRERRVTDAAVVRWAHSPDRWWRRAAVVSTVPLNQRSRGGNGDTPRTIMICELLAADRDDMVAKALSWALRALAGPDRQATSDFLERHDATIAARVRREVRNKLETGLKNPKRRV